MRHACGATLISLVSGNLSTSQPDSWWMRIGEKKNGC